MVAQAPARWCRAKQETRCSRCSTKVGSSHIHTVHDGGERQPPGWRSDGNSKALYACQIHPQNDRCAQPQPNRQPVGGADDSRAASRLLTGWGLYTNISQGLRAVFRHANSNRATANVSGGCQKRQPRPVRQRPVARKRPVSRARRRTPITYLPSNTCRQRTAHMDHAVGKNPTISKKIIAAPPRRI